MTTQYCDLVFFYGYKSKKNHTTKYLLLLELSIHYLSPLYPLRVAGELEPIPADFGREAEFTLDRSPTYRRANIHRQTTILSHSHLWSI